MAVFGVLNMGTGFELWVGVKDSELLTIVVILQ